MPVLPLTSRDPERIGGHRLVGRLGEGGQGVVYLAETETGERVAIKLLHDRARLDGFRKEIAAARRVSPFCTARILGDGEDEGAPYVVTEYIDGPSLREAVESDGPLTGPALYRLAVGTATALAAIHQAGVVHRDFKPGNVLLGPDGPRVIDFGIARALDATVTATSTVVGTPSYMAPEQLAGEPVGPRADVFAWGATIAYAANGRPPYGQDTIPAVMNRIMTGRPDLGALAGPLRDLVADCLSRDAAKRPDSREVLLRLLEHTEGPIPAAQALEQGRALAAADDQALADERTARWTTLRLDRPPSGRRPPQWAVLTGVAATVALLTFTGGAIALNGESDPRASHAIASPAPASRRDAPGASQPSAQPIRSAPSFPRTPTEIAAAVEQAMASRRTAAFKAEGLLSQSTHHLKATGRLQYRPGSATDYDMTVYNANPGLEDSFPTRVVLVGTSGYVPGYGQRIPIDPSRTDQGHPHLNLAVEARLLTSPYNITTLLRNASELKRTSDEGTHTYRGSASPVKLSYDGPIAPFYKFFADRRVLMTFTLTVTNEFLPARLDVEFRFPLEGTFIGASYWAVYQDWGRSGTIVKPY
ncbi:serine/threonine-protein kinase [Thermomonospora sp. CIF 1]|uniref:serine/threonine protein kinase n=1 Tax=Thermomonospora sp. CIF 1 TaxID=1916083 RepID=UPI000A6932F2|nr:serine/threonine-protein kinase [Thermomonospora sp. CIF 1]PKK14831.1 MAG: hypothetical protein BUE48_009435 [Thermomonospora sp. CIF 1]